MAFSFTNSKGQTYYLHTRTVPLRGNNRLQPIYYFSKTAEGALDAVPDGYSPIETTRTGMPVLKKTVPSVK